jgi:hypothetical protein
LAVTKEDKKTFFSSKIEDYFKDYNRKGKRFLA